MIELSIVIAVAAILAAMFVPDMIEARRHRMMEKTMKDVMALHDAARQVHSQIRRDGTTDDRWPGENNSGSCQAAAFTPGAAQGYLLTRGYITGGGHATPAAIINPATFLRNPWGEMYDLNVGAFNVAGTNRCLFVVATNIPLGLENTFLRFLPNSFCTPGPAGGGSPCPPDSLRAGPLPGFIRCCSYIPRPGNFLGGCPAGQRLTLGGTPPNTFPTCQ